MTLNYILVVGIYKRLRLQLFLFEFVVISIIFCCDRMIA